MKVEPHIIVEKGALKKLPALVKRLSNACVIVTDTNVRDYAEHAADKLEVLGVQTKVVVLSAGETSKKMETVTTILQTMVSAGLKRDGCVVGLGGGVVGDIAGFVASIYMRGIAYIAVPTTLLAMTDSSLGGKNGVDLPEGKNLVGTFYFPEVILCDSMFLKSLPDRAFRCGMAEIIKHAVIADKELFLQLEESIAEVKRRDIKVLTAILKRSMEVKLKIVKKDERESLKKVHGGTSRMFLNYGHTVGHAIEQLSDYKVPHGEAVAMGMVAENRLAVGKKLLKEADALRIKNLIADYGLPTRLPDYPKGKLKAALYADKKTVGEKLYFALPSRIGTMHMKAYDLA